MSSPISGRYIDSFDSFKSACSEVSKYMLEKGSLERLNKSSTSEGQQDYATCKDGTCVVTWKPSKHAV